MVNVSTPTMELAALRATRRRVVGLATISASSPEDGDGLPVESCGIKRSKASIRSGVTSCASVTVIMWGGYAPADSGQRTDILAAMRVVIVGAGMAGLTAGRALRDAGHDVSLVDKSRVVGGRMSSKRIGEARFDHGAQHFSARSPEFQTHVEQWRAGGVAQVWYEAQSVTNPERGVEPRHVGVGAMRTIPEYLSEGLAVTTHDRVERLQVEDQITVTTANTALDADVVVLTPPVPQILDILRQSGVDAPHELMDIRYEATLAAMATLAGPARLEDGHLALGEGPVAWIADNQHKGVSAVPAVTIHSSAGFAATHLEEDPERWLPELVAAAQSHLDATVTEATGHRWRYSRPTNPRSDGAMALAGGRIIVAGEAFSGAKVEGAFLSGRAAGLALRDRMGGR